MTFPEKIIERTDLRTVVRKAANALKAEGFTLLSEVELGRDLPGSSDPAFEKSAVLLACNPALAYKAISLDAGSGVFMTSRLAIREFGDGQVALSAFNPLECMEENMSTSSLKEVSVEVSLHLRRAMERLQLQENQ